MIFRPIYCLEIIVYCVQAVICKVTLKVSLIIAVKALINHNPEDELPLHFNWVFKYTIGSISTILYNYQNVLVSELVAR